MHSCLTFSSSATLRADNTSFTPCLANVIAKCLPMPLELPVIHTTLPLSTAITDYKLFFKFNVFFSIHKSYNITNNKSPIGFPNFS
jgi:hypothetical protein